MIPNNLNSLDKIKDQCRSMVTKRAVISAGAAAIPLPGVDIAVDITLITELICNINERFGLDPSSVNLFPSEEKVILQNIAKRIGNAAIGNFVAKPLVVSMLKKIGGGVATKSFTKYVPFVGQATSAAISFYGIKKVGNKHIDDCYCVLKEFFQSRHY